MTSLRRRVSVQRLVLVGVLAFSCREVALAEPSPEAPVASGFQYPVSLAWRCTAALAAHENCNGFVGEYYSRYDTVARTHSFCGKHLADDIDVEAGTAVFAIADGIVRFAKDKSSLGHAIHIEHKLPSGQYVTSVYYHLVREDMGGMALDVGQRVTKGQQIGITSARRADTAGGAPHLHFGIRLEDRVGYRGAADGQPSTNSADTPRYFDDRTGVWYYPGYTTIFSGGIRQCDTIGLEADELDRTHDEIVSEWESDPREFIRRRLSDETTPTTLLVDTFESYAAATFPTAGGWAIRPGATGVGSTLQVVSTTAANGGAQSLRLVGAASLGVNIHRAVTLPTTRRYMVEGYVNTTSATYKNAYLGVGGSTAGGDLGAGIRFMANGNFADASVSPIAGSYTTNAWTRLRVIVNPATGLYSAYVGDTLVGQDIPTAIPASSIERVWLAVDNGGVGAVTGSTAYFDDIAVVDCGVVTGGVDACPSGVGGVSTRVTFEVRGTITQVADPTGLASAAETYGYPVLNVTAGDPFTYRYTFDPSVADSLSSNIEFGDFAAITNATFTTPGGSYTFNAATLYRPGPISTSNGGPCLGGPGDQFRCDQYYATVQSQSQPMGSAEGSLYVQTFLQDFDTSALATDAIPLTPPVLGLFEQAIFRGGVSNNAGFSGSITSIQIVQ